MLLLTYEISLRYVTKLSVLFNLSISVSGILGNRALQLCKILLFVWENCIFITRSRQSCRILSPFLSCSNKSVLTLIKWCLSLIGSRFRSCTTLYRVWLPFPIGYAWIWPKSSWSRYALIYTAGNWFLCSPFPPAYPKGQTRIIS